jgi:peroxidase
MCGHSSSTADIDIFTGSVSERAVKGGAVGPLLACILGQQFRDIKYGDSHWYENVEKDSPFTSG